MLISKKIHKIWRTLLQSWFIKTYQGFLLFTLLRRLLQEVALPAIYTNGQQTYYIYFSILYFVFIRLNEYWIFFTPLHYLQDHHHFHHFIQRQLVRILVPKYRLLPYMYTRYEYKSYATLCKVYFWTFLINYLFIFSLVDKFCTKKG